MENGLRKKGMTRREFMKLSGAAMGAIGASNLFPSGSLLAAQAKPGGHFKPASVGYPVIRTLDPALASLICEDQTVWAIFNGLVRFDMDMNIVPDLAQSWTMPNETTYRFKLQPGIRFHDGGECTAEDVVFSLDRVRNPATGSPHKDKLKEVDQIRAVDKGTVEIITKQPFAPMLSYLCNARTGTQIVRRQAVEKLGADFGKNPVGTGPFKLVEWKPGEKVEFVKHDKYFMKGLPYVDRMTEVLIAEESTATNALLSKDVDFLSSVLFSDVKTLEATKGIKVVSQSGLNIRFTMMNCKAKPFDDPYVRQAFAHTVDKKQLLDAVLYGQGTVAEGIIPPAIKWAAHPNLKEQSFNPEMAKQLLKKSKYSKADLAFSILTFGTGWWKRWAEIVAAQTSEILSINVKPEVLDGGTVATRLQKGDFQSGVWGWRGLVEADEYAYENFHSKGSKNYSHYSNTKVDELLEKARVSTDKGKRAGYYHEAEEIIAKEAPYIFCFNQMEYNAYLESVKDFVQLPFNAFGQQFDRVWLDRK
ncbi:MAG: ABC transporter substrate-binding protein [Thermodesulfobacteriota bacterium]